MARRKKNFIAQAIKRPGALTRRAKSGTKRSVHAQAQHDMKHGSTLQKRQASFYLNVLSPANRKRGGGGKKKSGSTHAVKGHTRTVGGKSVRVKAHRRRNG